MPPTAGARRPRGTSPRGMPERVMPEWWRAAEGPAPQPCDGRPRHRGDVVARRHPGDRWRRRFAHPTRALRRQAGHGVAGGCQRGPHPRDRRHRLRSEPAARLPADHPQRFRRAAVGRGHVRRERRRHGRQRRQRHADPDRRPGRDGHRPPPLHARLRASRRAARLRRARPRHHRQRRDDGDGAVRGGGDRLRVRHHGVRHRCVRRVGRLRPGEGRHRELRRRHRAAGARRPHHDRRHDHRARRTVPAADSRSP